MQGLTQLKWCELNTVIEGDDCGKLLAITETQKKYENFNISENYKYVTSMRDMQDKRGGGLMIASRAEEIEMEKRECNNPDVMVVDVEWRGWRFKMILIYMDVQEEARNIRIKNKVKEVVEETDVDEDLILLGDFNAHLGFIGPQKLNKNGKVVIDLMEACSLILLNGDDRCEGQITRSIREERSSIDFVLVNRSAYNKFRKMEVDEEKYWFDTSDHCMIRVDFAVEHKKINKSENSEIVEYFAVKGENKVKYLREIENCIQQGEEIENMQDFHELIVESAEKILKRKCIRKNYANKRPRPVWFTRQIEEEIKKRKSINRKRRYATLDEREGLFQEYYTQKNKVKEMVKTAITEFEIQMTMEIREEKDAGKRMWKYINKLRGVGKKQAKVDIFDQNDALILKEELPKRVIEGWRDIYQMHNEEVETYWKEERKEQYIAVEYIDNTHLKITRKEIPRYQVFPAELLEHYEMVEGDIQRKGEKYKIEFKHEECMMIPGELLEHFDALNVEYDEVIKYRMERVKINKQDIISSIRRIKNGKQPGPDEMKGEMYKWMLESEICLKMFEKCFNEIVETGKDQKQ